MDGITAISGSKLTPPSADDAAHHTYTRRMRTPYIRIFARSPIINDLIMLPLLPPNTRSYNPYRVHNRSMVHRTGAAIPITGCSIGTRSTYLSISSHCTSFLSIFHRLCPPKSRSPHIISIVLLIGLFCSLYFPTLPCPHHITSACWFISGWDLEWHLLFIVSGAGSFSPSAPPVSRSVSRTRSNLSRYSKRLDVCALCFSYSFCVDN